MHIAITVIFFAVVIFIKLKMPMWKGKYSEKLVNNKIQELPEEYVMIYYSKVTDIQHKLTIL